MRIVGGLYRHRLIVFPEDANQQTRPTKDRIREAIFSALGDIYTKKVLDLYAGSGAMGLEALSRGASYTAFVDISPLAIKAINKNITNLQIPKTNFEIIKDYDTNALKIFKNKSQKFDIIFLDPPYEYGNYQKVVETLFENDLITERGVLVVEANQPVVLENYNWQRVKQYRYGLINVYIFWR